MVGVYIVSSQITPHLSQGVQEFGPQAGRVVHSQSLVTVFDDAIGWGPTIFLLYQKAISSQLQQMGAVGGRGRKRRFDLHGDHPPSLFDQVIWPTGEQVAFREKGFLAALPGPRVSVDYPALGETAPLPFAARPK
jgi:hypothetical protein